jgi:bifunctional non-homologous end joining protein LigD
LDQALRADCRCIPVERAIFDGEVVVIKDGRANFSALQAELASGRQSQMVFYAFELRRPGSL